jgi:ABC transporter substrate binding protein
MRRRQFIAGLGAVVWPIAAHAQQGDRIRRIGVLMPGNENDPLAKARISAFAQALTDLGWTVGRNVRIDLRATGDDINRIRAFAQELVGLQPDIIVTAGTPPTAAFQRETRTIPIVFASLGDPVASGIVARLDRPSGNVTGFADLEGSLGGKWLELLSEIAPGLKRVAFMSILAPELPHRFITPHWRRRPGHSRSSQSSRPFIATQISKRPSSPLGASREAGLSSCRIYSRSRIVRRSHWRLPGTTYRRSIGHLNLPETAVCSPTEPTR